MQRVRVRPQRSRGAAWRHRLPRVGVLDGEQGGVMNKIETGWLPSSPFKGPALFRVDSCAAAEMGRPAGDWSTIGWAHTLKDARELAKAVGDWHHVRIVADCEMVEEMRQLLKSYEDDGDERNLCE